jgi:hypothetical protein
MIESLYFFCYYAFILGNLADTQMYYGMLRDEFKTARPDSLKPHQYLELKKIKTALASGVIARSSWLEGTEMIPPSMPTVDMKQKELIRRIHDSGLTSLKEILQDDVYLYNLEAPCLPYGYVDMVYMGKNTVYPVEVKKDTGKHDLIGQICKYELSHKLKVHYKLYDFVRPLTICHTYQEYVVKELKQVGVLPLHYTIGNDKNVNLYTT